ncbi:MAG: hypothetical protein NG712_01330, partial [Omnitrophica bacterium]|nr:hypothetical protein [Candidatus Omnitrophota bacterium]
MSASTDYKGLIRQSSIIIFIVLALYLALVRPLAKQGVNILQGQIDEALVQLERYIPKEEEQPLPTQDLVRTLKAHLARNGENYQSLKGFIDSGKDYLPKGAQEPGLYFIEQLHITTKRLRRQANSLKIEIPEHFGFSEQMPDENENVEILLKELDIVDRVTTLLMEEGAE